MTEETKRRIQIREVIRAHLDKERELFAQGIKVLSLFFIDEVAKYRDYDREDTLGDYARVFEEEYAALVEEILGELELDAATDGLPGVPAPRRSPATSTRATSRSTRRPSARSTATVTSRGDEKRPVRPTSTPTT